MTNWPKIHLLEQRRARWRGKASYRRRELAKWKITGDRAHYWLDVHTRKHEAAAASKCVQQIFAIRKEIGKWSSLLGQAYREIHALEVAIAALRPKAQMWPMGGLVAPGEPYRVQREDQGRDLEVPVFHAIRAPGPGVCLEYAHDSAWPDGFGDPYVVVRIDAGRFHDMPVRRGVAPEWYCGHCNIPVVRPGEHFEAGAPLALANHGFSAGWGWCEWGHWAPGPMSEGASWEPALFAPVWR